MKRLSNAAFLYMLLGVTSGLFYREFTKINDFPAGEFTQLAGVHTHFLSLGFIVLLIVLALEKLFGLSEDQKLFTWFFWLYNAGLILTASMMIWHGSLTVLGEQGKPMISGIAGLGHMLLSAGMIVLFVTLRRALAPQESTNATASAV